MISKHEASQHEATIDTPELLNLLRHALRQFLAAAAENKFQAPLEIALRDAQGDCLREFRIEPTGTVIPGRTDDPGKLFVLPLTLFCMDVNGRIAKCLIGATHAIEATEFVN